MTPTGPRLSVVIPCFNAEAVLPRTLSALARQTVEADAFEVVVVDDGSTDGSREAAASWHEAMSVRVVTQPNRGQAAARNHGASAASAAVLLFLDADVIAQPDLVARHLRHHQNATTLLAVQGRTIPDPATLDSPFMWLSAGPMVDATAQDDLPPLHVIGRHLSITRSGHEACQGFDEGFQGYGLEDVDYALRFCAAGGRIRHDPLALGIHRHPMTVEAAAARQRQNGHAAVYLWRKHGCRHRLGLHLELHPALLPFKWLMYRTGLLPRLARRMRPWAERRSAMPVLNECYNILLWEGYYAGVFEALRPAAATALRRTA